MTDKQKRAAQTLRAALDACNRAGLVIIGMDATLHLFDRDALGHAESKMNPYDARAETESLDIDHPVYIDSGGW